MISDEEAEMEVLDCAIIVDKIKCNNQRLREVFAEFNPLKCRVAYKKNEYLGFAIVQFANKESTDAAMNNVRSIDGNDVVCRFATTEDLKAFAKKPKSAKSKKPAPIFPFESIHQELYDHDFYFIDFESALAIKGAIFPNEISIVKFSINKGEIDHFHRFINPGPIPEKYQSQADWNTRHITHIPWKDFDLGTTDIQQLYADLRKFLEIGDDDVFPPLFAKATKVENQCLQWISDQVNRPFTFAVHEVYDLASYLFSLVDKCYSVNVLNEFFKQNVDSESCHFHKNEENFHCALGDVRTYVEIIRGICHTEGLVHIAKYAEMPKTAQEHPVDKKIREFLEYGKQDDIVVPQNPEWDSW